RAAYWGSRPAWARRGPPATPAAVPRGRLEPLPLVPRPRQADGREDPAGGHEPPAARLVLPPGGRRPRPPAWARRPDEAPGQADLRLRGRRRQPAGDLRQVPPDLGAFGPRGEWARRPARR